MELQETGLDGDLLEVARGALAAYGLSASRLRVAARSYNAVLEVGPAQGRRYALRVGPIERIHPHGTEATEAAWMDALRAHGIAVPRIVSTRHGSLVVEVTTPVAGGPRPCVLFDWVEGRPLSEVMDAGLVRRAGTLAALLHEHAAAYAPSADQPLLRADRVLYWRIPSRLDELAPAYRTLFVDALDRVQATIDALWAAPPRPPHLLHGDLVPDNLMVHDGKLTAIDFQDLVWGLEVQDLAIAVSALRRYGDPQLEAAFRDGYAAAREWPDVGPDVFATLIAGRRLHQLNLGLNLRRPGLDGYVARIAALIGEWMAE